MRKKRRLREKIIAVFLMATVAVTMIPIGIVISTNQAHAATTYSYTVKRPTVKINGHTTHVSTFSVSGLGLTGTCCQAGTTAKSGKTTVKKLSNTDIRTKLIYYYGYQKGHLGKPNKNGFLLGRALSWSSGNTTVYPGTAAEVKKYINAMPSSVAVPNRFECYFCDPTNGSQNFVAYKMNPPGYITLNKTSADAHALAAGSGYSFEGIEYTVYDSNGSEAGKLTCMANGTTNSLTMDTGTYTVRETKTNQWYKMNSQVYTQTLTTGQTWTISAVDSPETGTVRIKKEVIGGYDGNLAFDFKLTNTANASISYTVKTDAVTGEAEVQVIQGNYRCEEILPDNADLIDITGPQTAEVKIGETCTFERENKVLSSGMLQIMKTTNDGGSTAGFRFKVTGVLFNQGKMTAERILDASDITVGNFDEDVYELESWEVSGNDLDELNRAAAARETGKRTVRLRNTLKYKGDKGISIMDIVDALNGDETEGTIAEGTYISDGGKVYKAKEEVAFAVAHIEEEMPESSETKVPEFGEIDRADTEYNIRELLASEVFEKVDTSDINITAEVAVDLKHVEYAYDSEDPETSAYETDTEKQIKNRKKVTEERNGYSLAYNGFDWYGAATVYQEIKNGELTGETEVTVETGTDGRSPSLSEGITYGRFTVEEVMTDAQKNQYRQPQEQIKEITKEDGKAAYIFNFENRARWTGVDLIKTSPDGNVSGITFKLEGKDTRGKAVKLEAVTDSDGKLDFGKLYAGEYVISEQDFDPDRYENNYKLNGYTVPAQKLVITGDETEDITVAFENVPLMNLYLTKVDKESLLFLKNSVFALFEGEEQLALFRIVLDDYGRAGIDMISCDENSGIRAAVPQLSVFPGDEEEQNEQSGGDEGDGDITIVEPHTDNESGETDGESEADEGTDESTGVQADYNFAVIKGLKEGKTYRLKEITAPAGYAASINYSFVFEDGQKLVLENAAPDISTLALDKDTKMHMSNAEGTVTIVDTVSYSNLGPGHKYIMSGVLACRPNAERTIEELEKDAEAIEIIRDAKGNEVTAQKEFVPESESGTIDIEFSFDASLLDGKQVVAMEQLVDPALTGVNGVITVVASHEDIEDEAQSIYFPEVGTKAIANDTGKRVTKADDEVVITDTVAYSNIVAGKVYKLTGTLMDKGTGQPLFSGGKPITSTIAFRAEKNGPVFASEGEILTETEVTEGRVELVSGAVELQFCFDASALFGKQAVAFEKLTTGAQLVGEHSDINDEEQTVYIPMISTAASTNGTDRINDKVVYTNLLPGESYVMRGILMDKATGEELLLNGNTVTAEMAFQPEEKDGSITMDFPVSVREMEGKTAVVFETCYLTTAAAEGEETAAPEVEVISHKDINNKAQTVTFDAPQTGQKLPWRLLAAASIFAVAAALALIRRIRKEGSVW